MSEEAELKRIGATPVRNSGRGLKKGDGILYPFLVDIKEYTNSHSVSRSSVAKLGKDCQTHTPRLEPMFVLVLGKEGEAPVRMWVVPELMGMQMHEAWMEKHGEV